MTSDFIYRLGRVLDSLIVSMIREFKIQDYGA
jgi:hypothetical protein